MGDVRLAGWNRQFDALSFWDRFVRGTEKTVAKNCTHISPLHP
jgi:hypothetical protein